jgi:anti-sigma B factor antagonist
MDKAPFVPCDGPTVVEVPPPRLRVEQVEALRQRLLGEVAAGNHHIVIDLKGVEFVDSSFLGLLVHVLKRVVKSGGDVRLCNLTPSIQSILSMIRLDAVFQVFDSREGAIKSFA